MKHLLALIIVLLVIGEFVLPGGVEPHIQKAIASFTATNIQSPSLEIGSYRNSSSLNSQLKYFFQNLGTGQNQTSNNKQEFNIQGIFGSGRTEEIKVSYYWPPLGGANCFDFQNGQCLSRVSGCNHPGWSGSDKFCTVGNDWHQLSAMGAAACPSEWPFGTRFKAYGKVWTCVDRGGAIKYGGDGKTFVDFLSSSHPGGSTVMIEFIN